MVWQRVPLVTSARRYKNPSIRSQQAAANLRADQKRGHKLPGLSGFHAAVDDPRPHQRQHPIRKHLRMYPQVLSNGSGVGWRGEGRSWVGGGRGEQKRRPVRETLEASEHAHFLCRRTLHIGSAAVVSVCSVVGEMHTRSSCACCGVPK